MYGVCVSLRCVFVAISAFVVNIISYFCFNDATRCHVAAVTKHNKFAHMCVCNALRIIYILTYAL